MTPGDDFTAPLTAVLRQNHKGEYVTHLRNHQAGGYFEGHYFDSCELWRAVKDWATRCESIGAPPTGVNPHMKEQIQEDIRSYLSTTHVHSYCPDYDLVVDELCQIIARSL